MQVHYVYLLGCYNKFKAMALVRQNSPKMRVFKFYQKLMNGIFQIFSWNFVSVKKFYGELNFLH